MANVALSKEQWDNLLASGAINEDTHAAATNGMTQNAAQTPMPTQDQGVNPNPMLNFAINDDNAENYPPGIKAGDLPPGSFPAKDKIDSMPPAEPENPPQPKVEPTKPDTKPPVFMQKPMSIEEYEQQNGTVAVTAKPTTPETTSSMTNAANAANANAVNVAKPAVPTTAAPGSGGIKAAVFEPGVGKPGIYRDADTGQEITDPADPRVLKRQQDDGTLPSYVNIKDPRTVNAYITSMGLDAAAESTQQQAALLERSSKDQQDILKKQQETIEKRNKDATLRDQKVREEANKRLNDIDAATKDLQNSKVDPERFEKNLSTGQQILKAIAISLGAMGASINKTRNFALDIIDQYVQNDIEAQKIELAKKGDIIRSKQSDLQRFLDTAGDERLAETALYSSKLQEYETALKTLSLNTKDSVEKAQASAALDAIKLKKAQLANEVRIAAYDTAQRQAAANAGIVEKQKQRYRDVVKEYKDVIPPDLALKMNAAIDNGNFTAFARLTEKLPAKSKVQMETDEKAADRKFKEEERQVDIKGEDGTVRTYNVRSKDDADRIKKNQEYSNFAISLLDEIVQMKENWASLSPSGRARVETLTAQFHQTLTKLNGNGVLNESDLKAADKIVPSNAADFSPAGVTDAKIQQAKSMISNGMKNMYNTLVPGYAVSRVKKK